MRLRPPISPYLAERTAASIEPTAAAGVSTWMMILWDGFFSHAASNFSSLVRISDTAFVTFAEIDWVRSSLAPVFRSAKFGEITSSCGSGLQCYEGRGNVMRSGGEVISVISGHCGRYLNVVQVDLGLQIINQFLNVFKNQSVENRDFRLQFPLSVSGQKMRSVNVKQIRNIVHLIKARSVKWSICGTLGLMQGLPSDSGNRLS